MFIVQLIYNNCTNRWRMRDSKIIQNNDRIQCRGDLSVIIILT